MYEEKHMLVNSIELCVTFTELGKILMPLLHGSIAGLIAGIFMGTVSDIGYRTGIFKSSLIVIDGSFIQNLVKMANTKVRTYLFGIPVHLFTSVSFGIAYTFIVNILNLYVLTVWIIAAYVFLLWISMLFVALPVAGQGFLGNKISSLVWLEQLVLHVFFGIGLWGALYALQG